MIRKRDELHIKIALALPFLLLLLPLVECSSDDSSESFPFQFQLPSVEVFDNVLSTGTAEWLHKECADWNRKEKKRKQDENFKGAIIEFPLLHPEKHSPLKQFLNGLVWQIECSSKSNASDSCSNVKTNKKYYIEYWTRQEWHHILAHQDMDEELYRKYWKEKYERWKQGLEDDDDVSAANGSTNGGFRHPLYGHVLYLQVGKKVSGPTVVFNATNGRDLMGTNPTTIYTIPAVKGRLLRFQGDRLHAVPRPNGAYWTFDQSSIDIHEPESDYQRSVLLINLWEHSGAVEGLLVDKILDCGDGQWIENRTTCEPTTNGDSIPSINPLVPPPSTNLQHCNKASDWNAIPIRHKGAGIDENPRKKASMLSILSGWFFPETRTETFSVPLMGDARKRGIGSHVAYMQSISSWSDKKSRWINPARESFGEPWLPTSIEIETDNRYRVEQEL